MNTKLNVIKKKTNLGVGFQKKQTIATELHRKTQQNPGPSRSNKKNIKNFFFNVHEKTKKNFFFAMQEKWKERTKERK